MKNVLFEVTSRSKELFEKLNEVKKIFHSSEKQKKSLNKKK